MIISLTAEFHSLISGELHVYFLTLFLLMFHTKLILVLKVNATLKTLHYLKVFLLNYEVVLIKDKYFPVVKILHSHLSLSDL